MAAKILLVEDDNNLREIYEARLQAEGYNIVAAKDGEEALVVAKAEKPDLIISDVMMPRISGFEMLDILRNTEELKYTKVIMLTALGQADDKTRANSLGADRYLVKSQVTLEDIVKAAHSLIEGDDSPKGATTPSPTSNPPQPPTTPAPDPPQSPVSSATSSPSPPPTEPASTTVAPVMTAPTTSATEAAPTVTSSPITPTDTVSPTSSSSTSVPTTTSEEPEPSQPAPEQPVASSPAPQTSPKPLLATPPEELVPGLSEESRPQEPDIQAISSTSVADEKATVDAQIDSYASKSTTDELSVVTPTVKDEAVLTKALDDLGAGNINKSETPSAPLIPVREILSAPSTQEVSETSDPARPDSKTPEDDTTQRATSVPIANKKVIQPPIDSRPKLNDLLAAEEAKNILSTQPPPEEPPESSVAVPAVTPGSTFSPTSVSTATEPSVTAPAGELDPNSITL